MVSESHRDYNLMEISTLTVGGTEMALHVHALSRGSSIDSGGRLGWPAH